MFVQSVQRELSVLEGMERVGRGVQGVAGYSIERDEADSPVNISVSVSERSEVTRLTRCLDGSRYTIYIALPNISLHCATFHVAGNILYSSDFAEKLGSTSSSESP